MTYLYLFTAGPISQHDTIELRGFEDIPEDGQMVARGKKTSRSKGSKYCGGPFYL